MAHQTEDTDHGIIVGLTVTPGDVHDSVPYLKHLEAIHKNVIVIEAATAPVDCNGCIRQTVLTVRHVPCGRGA